MFDLKFYKPLFPMVRLIYVNAVYETYPPRAYLIDLDDHFIINHHLPNLMHTKGITLRLS